MKTFDEYNEEEQSKIIEVFTAVTEIDVTEDFPNFFNEWISPFIVDGELYDYFHNEDGFRSLARWSSMIKLRHLMTETWNRNDEYVKKLRVEPTVENYKIWRNK